MSGGTRAERYEKAFLGLSAVMLVVVLGALFYAATAIGISLPSRAGELDPTEVRSTPPFDEPGIHRLGPDRYEVVMIGRAWGFEPLELTLPAGAEIVFRLTSSDVIHGFDVEGTRLNAMLIPGQVTELTYTFKESWELAGILTGLGGSTMFLSGVLFFVVMLGTFVLGRRNGEQEIPFTETELAPATSGWEVHMDRFRYWVAVTIVLILIAYGPFLVGYLPPRLLSPGFGFF